MNETRAALKQEFERYLQLLEANGIQCVDVDCPTCDGEGKYLCPNCGKTLIDCEKCGGKKKVTYPSFEDYVRIRRNEKIRYEMWLKGEALPQSINTSDWPMLPDQAYSYDTDWVFHGHIIEAPKMVILRLPAGAQS